MTPAPVHLDVSAALHLVPPHAGEVVAAVAQPTPAPTPVPEFDPLTVSPGLIGFIPVFLIALVSVLLFLSLTRHLRRVTVRQAARDAAEAAGTGAAPGAGAPDFDGPTTGRGRDAATSTGHDPGAGHARGTGDDPDPGAPRRGAGGPRRP